MSSNPHAIVIGVGPGLGAALVQKCLTEGMKVSAGARDRDRLRTLLDERGLQDVPALRCDVSDPASVDHAFGDAISDGGVPDLMIFNASGYARGSILDLTPGQLEAAWRVGCLGGFIVGQAAAKVMVPAERGTILFTGATASLRGSANFAPFAIAKFGLRALAQSMARELGPKGIHVAHMLIDGQIGTAEGDTKLKPADIAEAYWSIYRQPRSAWTLEADLRTWVEKF
ncbi:SDR family NAD(P)-dependent oxidoreductase [Dongia deserti]|uniref:SDR family NAD(P)-dependent oxidoreductase n=1 Tax=Dongia deserti TaxID=2268030 RepID=UPI000E65A8B6|nr:SDR family NAD(P)-dependent oxidoreductase [Dongia deserti]